MLNYVSKDNRELKHGQLVGVHYNSHKNCFSVVEFNSRKTQKKVIGYVDSITLVKCTVKIDKSKQKNVIESGTKDRHAFIVGYVDNTEHEQLDRNIYYNPMKIESFVDAENYFNGYVEYLENMERVNLHNLGDRPLVTYQQ